MVLIGAALLAASRRRKRGQRIPPTETTPVKAVTKVACPESGKLPTYSHFGLSSKYIYRYVGSDDTSLWVFCGCGFSKPLFISVNPLKCASGGYDLELPRHP